MVNFAGAEFGEGKGEFSFHFSICSYLSFVLSNHCFEFGGTTCVTDKNTAA